MTDIALEEALLLWDPSGYGKRAAFVVRPIGHSDYYVYRCQTGACWDHWRNDDDRGRRLKLMIEAWHISAFYGVPVETVHNGLLAIPEYRDMLAADCLVPESHDPGQHQIELKVHLARDDETGHWYVAESDIPGLHLDAETPAALIEKISHAAPEMIELNYANGRLFT